VTTLGGRTISSVYLTYDSDGAYTAEAKFYDRTTGDLTQHAIVRYDADGNTQSEVVYGPDGSVIYDSNNP
jgi:hypothetical protein